MECWHEKANGGSACLSTQNIGCKRAANMAWSTGPILVFVGVVFNSLLLHNLRTCTPLWLFSNDEPSLSSYYNIIAADNNHAIIIIILSAANGKT